MNFFGIPIRVSAQVPPDEMWWTQPDGYEREEIVDERGLTLRVVERHKIIGKIVGLASSAPSRGAGEPLR